MNAEAPRLYTPEEAAAILNGHPAPFSARAGDVTPGGLRAAAHRREIPFRLWRGKVRFTDEDLQAAVAQTAVLPFAVSGGIPPTSCGFALRPGRSRRGAHANSANVSASAASCRSRRRLIAKTAHPGIGRAACDGR
jgi:hypothetical protein